MMKRVSFYGSVLAALLWIFTGCATAPENHVEQLPLEVPVAWVESTTVSPTGTPIQVGWLADFRSDALQNLAEHALTKNFDLQATAARLDIARAEAVIAGADLSPQVGLGFDGSRQKISLGSRGLGNVGPASNIFNSYGLTGNVSWELDVWGRLRDRKSAALGDVQVAEETLEGVRLSLVANVCLAYFDVVEAELQRVLAVETVESFQATESVITRRFENGTSQALDLRLIRSQLSGAHAARVNREQQLDVAMRNLKLLLGDYPDTEAALSFDDFPEITNGIPVGMPSELLSRRPDLKAAERRLAAASVRVSEAKKALLPAISLTGSYGTTSDQLSDLLDHSFSIWSLAGNVVQPIFQGRRLQAGVRRAEALAEQRVAEYGQATLTAFKEVEQALAAGTFLDERLEYLQVTAEELRAAESLAWDQYQRGLTDIITVLDTQRRAFDAESAYLSAQEQRLTNRVQLYLALGGNFNSKADTTAKME